MPTIRKIFDSDGHVFEPQDIWLRYLDASLREVLTKTPGLENGNSTGNDGPPSLFPLGFVTETGRKDLLQMAAGGRQDLGLGIQEAPAQRRGGADAGVIGGTAADADDK